MDLNEAKALAEELIAEHLDASWTFGWINHLTVMGQCSHHQRRILLARKLTPIADDDAVRDTILHEIAHALAGPSHDHDATWRRLARSLGCPDTAHIDPARVGNPRETLAPWVGTCPAGHVSEVRYFRKPRARYACSVCCQGKWQEQHVLTYRKMF
jgi:SprT protein